MFGYDSDGPNGYFHLVGLLVSGVVWIFFFLLSVALIFILVRFLLIATKAAHIYVARNSPAKPVVPPAHEVSPAPPAPAAPAAPVVAATKPATKPRTPKTPPTA